MAHPRGPVARGFQARIRALEEEWLSPLAVRSYGGGGRRREEDEECPLRTPFQRDRDRIVHCKAFRRLKHKTQVFIDPAGDHFRTRLTHTLEVSGIARGVARGLRLNEDLAEAVALGHDLGHPPFGHTGEAALDAVLERRSGRRFRHNEQSLRVVDVLEQEGLGLNLSLEVREGILTHTGEGRPATLEAAIVRLVDRFAYVNHDIDDAIRAGILDAAELPRSPLELLGESSSERIDALVHDLVETSDRAAEIRQGDACAQALLDLRAFMFERVYLGDFALAQKQRAVEIVDALFGLYEAEPELVGGPPAEPGMDAATRAVDWIAGMTDRYCMRTYEELVARA